MIINISGSSLRMAPRYHRASGRASGGDMIISAGGKEVNSIKDLISVIEGSGGKPVNLVYRRNDEEFQTTVQPIKSAEDTQYRIGIWVRDSSAGIGTLTYIDPRTKIYGALGHGINDIDTGSLLQVGSGQLMRSSIKGIKKGVKGVPGELEGDFMDNVQVIAISKRTVNRCLRPHFHDIRREKGAKIYPLALIACAYRKATILSCIRDDQVEEFEIEIQRISKWDLSSTKNMVIQITDKRLLDATGGIVQGMSGSPILQDGKLIGAVTHVFINDPVKGYGVFIESMLDKSNAIARSTSFPNASGF
jgi:stage IV sporulation protein B